ncbi:hypothetical protein ZWY2020_051982 [Hordeum vulgare]|nr:hypothetical protein ZWY2020_051982 [Hordeum vulgare]
MVLVAEKLGAAGLALVREFAIDCSYGPSYVFEASGGRLRVIGRVGVGIDSVDLAAATEHGCLVVNAPTANTIATAEHDIVVVCSMARNVAQANTSLKSNGTLVAGADAVPVLVGMLEVEGPCRCCCIVLRSERGCRIRVPPEQASGELPLGACVSTFGRSNR